MAGRGGRRPGAGRPKGSPTKYSERIAEMLSEMDCDPIVGMARLAKEAEANGEKGLAGQMYRELAQYVAPKRKAVEMTVDATITAHEDLLAELE